MFQGHNIRLLFWVAITAVIAVCAYFLGSYRARVGLDGLTALEVERNETVRQVLGGSIAYTLVGLVTARSDASLTMDVASIGEVAIPADTELRVREVRLVPTTVLAERTRVSSAEYSQALRAYRATAGAPPPSPYLTRPIGWSDLRVGDRIAVDGVGGFDLSTTPALDAGTITKINE